MVAPFHDFDGNGRTRLPLHDDDVPDRGRIGERLVRRLLERNDLPAPVPAVRRHEQHGLRVVDAVAERLGAESAEDHAVHGADARAGEHRDGEFGDERQVQGYAVAACDAERLQHVGKGADLPVQVPVRERAAVARFPFPDDRGLVAAGRADVPVEAVRARVDLAAREPARVRRLPVEDGVPRLDPLEFARERLPEGFGVGERTVVHARIGDVRRRLPRIGGREPAIFLQ